MADHSACFLKQHRPEIIQKTRNPIGLADALCAEDCVGNEMYEKIRKEKLEANQMREIYKCLTLTKHFERTYDWLKENEPDLLEELENKDPEAAAPQRKRSRSNTNQTVDETDNNHTGFPDLNVISTYAKLEKWVSEAKNSQKR
ncbi:hypothetical protein AMELA_G00281930 [Ameiurus melas]|uniref:CARD domain-containing protein n=1 Tax=Ameiurus melas TaxID=219545 RepID=A0A7J5ZL71_AMEME|nr:hypothetical protein AMELA_G00281930 [Ameiurus melas]